MGKSMTKKSSGGGAGGIAGIIVTIAVLAIAAGAGWYFFLRPTPEKCVTKFLDAAYGGQTDIAKSCLSEASQAQWDRMSGMFKRSETATKKEKDYKIGKITQTGSTSVVTVSVAIPAQVVQFMGGKTSLDMPFACLKEKGAWKVDLEQTGKEMQKSIMSNLSVPGMGGAAPAK
jgi:hypothetical protein